ncbi:unnamed protein product, partial [Prunus brigantina]
KSLLLPLSPVPSPSPKFTIKPQPPPNLKLPSPPPFQPHPTSHWPTSPTQQPPSHHKNFSRHSTSFSLFSQAQPRNPQSHLLRQELPLPRPLFRTHPFFPSTTHQPKPFIHSEKHGFHQRWIWIWPFGSL